MAWTIERANRFEVPVDVPGKVVLADELRERAGQRFCPPCPPEVLRLVRRLELRTRGLVNARYAGVPIQSLGAIPYFENMFPGLAGTYTNLLTGTPYVLTATQAAYRRFAIPAVGGRNSTDYTFGQLLWDDQPVARINNVFYQPQYAALSVFSTIAESNYNALQFSVRKRMTWPFGKSGSSRQSASPRVLAAVRSARNK